MNVSYVIIGIAVKSVIVIIPALIRTEFLIGPATDYPTAIETFFFHSTKVLIKILKTIYKRLKTASKLYLTNAGKSDISHLHK